MSPAKSERVELKYCEGCGCLLTRPVGSGLAFCSPCEAKQSKDEMYLRRPGRSSARPARLPNGFDLRGVAEPGNGQSLRLCA